MLIILSFFPHPYPDELLYSVFARYHAWSGNKSPKLTLDSLFGSRNITAVIDLPSHLEVLKNNLPVGTKYNVRDLIYKHTLFPYYEPFLTPKNASKIYQAMIGNKGGNIHSRAGIMASSITLPQYFRFCPKCSEQDFSQYGELYWHRLHQIPGVLVCPVHNLFLQDSVIKTHQHNRHEFIQASHSNCYFNTTENFNPYYTKIALEIEWLINQEIKPQEIGWFQENYVSLLYKKGLATFNGLVNHSILANNIKNHYNQGLLRQLDCEITDSESNWLKCIVRKHRKAFHPIRHILMILYLTGSLDNFFGQKITSLNENFFGYGPWPCLNKVAEHYLKPVIEDIQITYSKDIKRPIGTFACSCGLVYTRTGPEKIHEERYKIGKIKSFGEVWLLKLKELASQDLSLREIARRLYVDPKTVKIYIQKYGIKKSTETINELKSDKVLFSLNNHKEVYRKSWIQVQVINPLLSKTELRRIKPAIYKWLYRNDLKWLNFHSPQLKNKRPNFSRVNWSDRDEELLVLSQEAVKLIFVNQKPQRITLSRIGNLIDSRALLEKHLDKLPKTKAYLNTVVEDIDAFQIRRLKWAINNMKRTNDLIIPWKVKRVAGLGKNISEYVINEINKINIGDGYKC